ncbi:MAG: hypothetical protein PHR45_08065 [Muribaculaceae bacterium]|nr:hypothetical protein [Muribaculaceae bacterium]
MNRKSIEKAAITSIDSLLTVIDGMRIDDNYIYYGEIPVAMCLNG